MQLLKEIETFNDERDISYVTGLVVQLDIMDIYFLRLALAKEIKEQRENGTPEELIKKIEKSYNLLLKYDNEGKKE